MTSRFRPPLPSCESLSFTALLDSSLPGVRFTAHLTAGWTVSDPWLDEHSARFRATIRHTVRKAVAPIAKLQAPADPLGVADAVLCGVPAPVKATEGLVVTLLAAEFDLDEASRASLADYDATHRSDQQRQDALKTQIEGLRELLADPGSGPTWMLRHRPELAERSAELLKAIEVTGPTAPADPLVELFRDFIAPLSGTGQRLITLRAVAMILRGLDRDDLADRAELLIGQDV